MSGNCQNCLHWGPPTAKTGDLVQLVASYNFRVARITGHPLGFCLSLVLALVVSRLCGVS